ncbi:MAG TPA: zinc ribbon domain-containing protein [Solirubrobacteraceae bacterium]
MSTDPTAITTEIPVTAAPGTAAAGSARAQEQAESTAPIPAVQADPLAALGAAAGGAPPQPGDPAISAAASAQAAPAGVEPCPHCGTSLALDQRYCLECGAPRTYLSGMLLDRLRAPAAAQGGLGQPTQPPIGGLGIVPPAGPPLTPTSPGGSAWQRGSVLTLIASIGVLLLAMGVGVLIGRSGGTSSGGSAPQIVTVPAAASGAASTTTTPTTPAENPTAKAAAGAAAAAAAAKHKAKESGVGATPSKPAPPTVLKNLRTGSGQSYEQKSKNLPNVVSTG